MRLPLLCVALLASCARDLSLPPLAASTQGSVFGRAVYSAPGSGEAQPAAGCVVMLSASSLSVTAGSDGRFDLEGINTSTGTLLFQFDSDGDGVFDRQRSISLSSVGAQAGRQINLGDVVVGENARVHGLVLRTDLRNVSGGHAGTQAFVPLTPFVTYSANDGQYVLDGIPAGPVSIGFFRAGYLPASLEGLELQPGEDFSAAEVDLVRDDGTQVGTLTGTVTYQPDPSSAAGAAITATNVETGTVTPATSGDDGTFTLTMLPTGLYDVRVSRDTYTPLLVPNVLVFPTQTTSLDLSLGQGTSSATDGGRPPAPDAGPSVACVSTADCGPGQWCDGNFCAELCGSTVSCSEGRVCDAQTHTCVTPCTSTCPSDEMCDPSSRTCRALCDVGLPCPTGLKCSTNLCVAQCAVDSDCPTKHQTCQGGACIPDGTCDSDFDCPVQQLCAGVLCANRKTPDGGTDGGWPCSSPCDCRLGETCAAGVCAADGVPTLVLFDGGGLDVALAAAHAGDLIALTAGTTWYANDGFTLATAGVTLSGGYVSCGGPRWLFDPTQSATLASDGGTALRVAGSAGNPLGDVTLRGLTLQAGQYPGATVAYDALSASSAPRLHLAEVQGNFFGATTATASRTVFHVAASSDVKIENLSIVPAGVPLATTGLWLDSSDATLVGFVSPTLAGPQTFTGLRIDSPAGPVTVLNASVGLNPVNYSQNLVATNCGANPLEIGSSHFFLSPSVNVALNGCAAVNVHDCWLDGSASSSVATYVALGAQGSAGTVARTRVTLPALSNATSDAFSLKGNTLSGPWTLTDDTVDGCAVSGSGAAIDLNNGGNITITGFNVGGADAGVLGASCNLVGLNAVGTNTVTLSRSTLIMPAVVPQAPALQLTGTNLIVERSIVIGGMPLVEDTSNVEVYSSFFYTLGNGAMHLTKGQLYAVGDTFDGQGPTGAANTYGLACLGDPASTVPVAFMTNCILNGGGGSTSHLMFYNANSGAACFDSTHFDHNYFYFSGPGGRSQGEEVSNISGSTNGTPDSSGNIVGENMGCYGVNVAHPSYLLMLTSPCVDSGAIGNRNDGTALNTDINGTTRDNGPPDIGCYEYR